MSDKRSMRTSVLLDLAVAFCLEFFIGTPGRASGFPDVFEDPLHSRPPVLEVGPVLPGDGEPIVCPPRVDLTQPLVLNDAVDMALCNNAQIKVAWAAIKIQASAVGQARAAYFPTLTAAVAALRSISQYPDSPSSDSSSFGHSVYGSLTWRLLDFGGRGANREASNELLVAALATHDAALQKIANALVGAYFDALTAKASLEGRAKGAELAQATLIATKERESKGVGVLNDTLQANTALAKANLELHRAQGQYEKDLSVLVYNMGLPSTVQVTLPDAIDEAGTEFQGSLRQWLADAKAHHPALTAARAQWEAAKANVDAARSDGLPTLDLTANVYQNGYPNQGLTPGRSTVTTIGISLNIPVFDGFARTYKIRGAQAQVEQSEAQSEDVEHQVLSDVIKAYADVVSSLENLQSSEALVNAAEEAVASSGKRYAKGAADVLELLTAQSAFADARQERIRCVSDWRSARLRLLSSAGLLGRKRLRP